MFSLVWTNSRPPGTAPATTGTTGPGPAPATPHTGLHVFPYLACETSHLAKQSSQPGSPTGPAGTACPSLPPSARPAPASIFDFRPLFQATDAVPCCCKRTTKSSVLSCRAASATATLMFAAIGLAPMCRSTCINRLRRFLSAFPWFARSRFSARVAARRRRRSANSSARTSNTQYASYSYTQHYYTQT